MLAIVDHLNDHFRAGRTHLVATKDKVYLATRRSVFAKQKPGTPAFLVAFDLEQLWRIFGRQIGKRKVFSADDLATVAGVRPDTIVSWREAGVTSEGPQYDVFDAFSAAVAGALKRQSVPLRVIYRAARYLRLGEMTEANK